MAEVRVPDSDLPPEEVLKTTRVLSRGENRDEAEKLAASLFPSSAQGHSIAGSLWPAKMAPLQPATASSVVVQLDQPSITRRVAEVRSLS